MIIMVFCTILIKLLVANRIEQDRDITLRSRCVAAGRKLRELDKHINNSLWPTACVGPPMPADS